MPMGVSESAGGATSSSLDALLGGSSSASGGNRNNTKDGYINATAAALGGMNKNKDKKIKDDFDPLADILGEDWAREPAAGKTRGVGAIGAAGNTNANANQFGTRPRSGGGATTMASASTTPPISRTPPLMEKKEPDPMEDLSIDDDQLRELMEQNAKLEQELASRYEEPKEKKKETEINMATVAEELLLKKDPSGGMNASAESAASYGLGDFSAKKNTNDASHGLSSVSSQSHAHSSGAGAPYLDTLEENSEEEAEAEYTPAPRVGPGRAHSAVGGKSSYHTIGALGNNPTIEEESQQASISAPSSTHTPPPVAAAVAAPAVSSTDHGTGSSSSFGRRHSTDDGSNLLPGSQEGAVGGGGGGFGRRHSLNEGSGNKQIGRKPKTQIDAKDFDSFLDEFVNAADSPKETAPPAPQGQKNFRRRNIRASGRRTGPYPIRRGIHHRLVPARTKEGSRSSSSSS